MPERNITTGDCENYLQRLTAPGRELMLESASGSIALNDNHIKESIEISADFIGKQADKSSTFKALLSDLQQRIKKSGKDLLEQVILKDVATLNKTDDADLLLEAIVMTDGSRPSFLIRNDEPDFNSNPKGIWEGQIAVNSLLLTEAIRCVGRIESPTDPDRYWGTCFLIAENLIMTNLHVLEEITTPAGKGSWRFKFPVQINFGREKQGVAEKNIRQIEAIVFWGKPISGGEKLDMALFRLKPADRSFVPLTLITPGSQAFGKGAIVYSVGYPGPPRPGHYKRAVINLLFADGFGYKRLAPGVVQFPPKTFSPISFTHDATTLGGNSGSPVLLATSCLNAAGLHFAGTPLKANFAHVLSEVSGLAGGDKSGKTVTEIFKDYGI